MLIIALSLYISILSTPVTMTFDDMDDADFAAFVQAHDNFRVQYGKSAGQGCVTGAAGSAPAGINALCLGCVLGAAGNVAADMIFPDKK